MKKRLLSLALALALCLGLVMPVSAEDSSMEEKWRNFGQSETGLSIYAEETTIMTTHGPYVAGIYAGQLRPLSITCYGLKDAAGNVVLPAEYSELEYVGPDRLLVTGKDALDDGQAIVTLSGEIIIPFAEMQRISAVQISASDTPLFHVSTFTSTNVDDGDPSLFDWNGNVLIPSGTYFAIYHAEDNYFGLFTKDGKCGIYEYGRGIIIPCQYKFIKYLGGDMFSVANSQGMFGAIDKYGKQWLAFEHEYITKYTQGCFIVSKFISQSNNSFLEDRPLMYGYVAVTGDKLVDALVDGDGKYLIPYQYDAIILNDDGSGYAGMWTGKYKYNLGGSSGGSSGTGKIYDYTYSFNLQELLAQKGGIPAKVVPLSNLPATTTPTSAFSDISASSYYADAVSWAVSKAITNGTSTTAFSPEENCTQAQILTFLWRASGKPTLNLGVLPTWVDEAYQEAVLWAAYKNMIDIVTFDPDKPCTRSTAVSYIWQALDCPSPTTSARFSDVSQSAAYAQAVSWAVGAGVTNGTSTTTFSPSDTCTRGQIVTFLYRAMG